LLALLSIPLIALTRERNEVWRDELSLWGDTAAKSPESGRAQMNLGLALMKRGKYDEAESRFRRCLSITPYYHYAHTNLAIVLATKGDKIGAAAAHEAAVSCAGSEGGPYYWRARFRAKEGNLPGAIEDLNVAVQTNPAAFREAAAFVECLIRVGRAAETPALIAKYSAADPQGFELQRSEFRTSILGAESAVAVNDRGVGLMRQGKFAEAEALYRHALELDPSSHLAMTNMGIVRGAQSDAAGESQWHDKAVQTGGDDASPWYWRARSLAAHRQLERAVGDLQVSLTKRNAGMSNAAALAAVLLAQVPRSRPRSTPRLRRFGVSSRPSRGIHAGAALKSGLETSENSPDRGPRPLRECCA
jgi:Flp pilus assembly protein TadD